MGVDQLVMGVAHLGMGCSSIQFSSDLRGEWTSLPSPLAYIPPPHTPICGALGRNLGQEMLLI